MATTPNYGLALPTDADPQDVAVLDSNFTIIDTQLKTVSTKTDHGGELPYWIATTSATTNVTNAATDQPIKNWVTSTANFGLGTSDVGNNEFSYNNTTGELTIKKAGIYSFLIHGTTGGDTGGSRILKLKQGANFLLENRTMPIDASTTRLIPLALDVVVAANDLMLVTVAHGAGTTPLACFAPGTFSRWSVICKRLF